MRWGKREHESRKVYRWEERERESMRGGGGREEKRKEKKKLKKRLEATKIYLCQNTGGEKEEDDHRVWTMERYIFAGL